MQNVLMQKLWTYIVHNNPDLLFKLQEEYSVAQYLEEKVSNVMPILIRLLSEERPQYVIEELCSRPSLASVYLPFTKFCSARSAIFSLHPHDPLRRASQSWTIFTSDSVAIFTLTYEIS